MYFNRRHRQLFRITNMDRSISSIFTPPAVSWFSGGERSVFLLRGLLPVPAQLLAGGGPRALGGGLRRGSVRQHLLLRLPQGTLIVPPHLLQGTE